MELSEQEVIRREKLKAFQDLGVNPYPAAEYPVNAYAKEILEFAKMQIVTSTSSAMLAQSNQMQQSSILGLVR
ncbi:MAG: hypothetical protein IJQ56_07245 [Synergistaceae bacterium]|nr:hypothetical protein [Synergistaceae bacterium]